MRSYFLTEEKRKEPSERTKNYRITRKDVENKNWMRSSDGRNRKKKCWF